MTENLPTLNALLNSTSALLLIMGYRAMKRGEIQTHKKFMISTFGVSILFLISYLTYHYLHGSTKFMAEGWIRPVYFTILGTHTILAAAIVPMAIITLRRGLRMHVALHKAVAKWTFPIWLYVSVTGVVIYLMLYHLYAV